MKRIYFTQESIDLINTEDQTETIRTIFLKQRYKIGDILEVFARDTKKHSGIKIKIIDIKEDQLLNITEENAKRNGCKNKIEFFKKYDEINSKRLKISHTDNREVAIMKFKLVKKV